MSSYKKFSQIFLYVKSLPEGADEGAEFEQGEKEEDRHARQHADKGRYNGVASDQRRAVKQAKAEDHDDDGQHTDQ